jgi:hypothetical protein
MIRLVLALAALAVASPARADGTADGMDPGDLHLDGVADGTRASEALNQMSELDSRMSGAASQVSSAAGLVSDLFNAFNALSDLDHELHNHLQDDHSGPEVPTSCGSAAASPTCAECYAAAYREVNFTRNTLERLRTIDARTLAFINAAVSVGDTTSGIHAVTGLSWQYAKADVETEKRQFLTASRAKYDGLIQNMRRALDMVARCEADNFHNPDWYNRYGFMYFNFVQEAYRVHE